MRITNIEWDIDMDDILDALEIMTAEEVAAALEIPNLAYENMSTSERMDYTYQRFERNPQAKANVVNLPVEVEIPSGVEEVADYLSDKYGYCVCSFDMAPEFAKVYFVKGADDTEVEGTVFAICSTKDSAELIKETMGQLFENDLEIKEWFCDRFTLNDNKINLAEKPMDDEELRKKIDSFTPYEQDKIYRYLWSKRVCEDVRSHAEDMEVELDDDAIEAVVNRYVYNADYDCNLSYWDNIGSLIEDVIDTK